MECLYVDEDYDGFTNFDKGISWLLKNSFNYGGFIAVMALEDINFYANYPGMSALLKLIGNPRHISIINSVKLELISTTKIPLNGLNRPLLAIHPTEIYLDILSSIPGISKILVIPWNKYEITNWIYYSQAKKYLSDVMY